MWLPAWLSYGRLLFGLAAREARHLVARVLVTAHGLVAYRQQDFPADRQVTRRERGAQRDAVAR